MPMSRRWAGTPVTSLPPTSTWPRSTVSRPPSTRSAVVLPQPDGPSSDTSSPGSTCRSSPSSAGTPPYARWRSTRWTPAPDVMVILRRGSLRDGQRLDLAGGPATAGDHRQGEQEGEGEQQRGERHGDRQRGVALADEVHRDLQVREVQQRGQRELAEHERHGQQRGREHSAADAGQRDAQQHGAPAGAEAAGGLRQRREVHGREPRLERAEGVRQDEHDVDEGQRQRGVAEEVRHPRVQRGDADDEHDGRDHERQQAEVLDETAQRRHPQVHPHHRREQQDEHQHARQDGELQRGDDRLEQQRVVADRPPGVEVAPALQPAAGGELEHREQRQQEEDAEHEQDPVPEQPGAHAAHLIGATATSGAAAGRTAP